MSVINKTILPISLFHTHSFWCSKSTAANDQIFFVGGVNLFSHSTRASDFVGSIRNLIIDSVQVDLANPLSDQNTIPGAVFSPEPACSLNNIQCNGFHYRGCSDYATESHCICAGGFHHKSCSEENSKFMYAYVIMQYV